MINQVSTSPVAPAGAQQRMFRTLNRFLEPAVRAGLGSTLAGPAAFVVETTGRHSGLPRRVPLLAKRIGDTIIVSTIRDDSQWIRNLEHHPVADIWIAGRPRRASATVVRVPGATIARLRLEPLTAAGSSATGRRTAMIGKVVERWHQYLRGDLPEGPDELLDDDVVF